MRFGAGLWCLQATATAPRPHGLAYTTLRDDARHLERHGYESLWLSEHHFFYDGYCPALLPVASAVLAATSRLRVGTGMMLMPLQDAERAARMAAGIAERHGGRIDVGMGLGYRDVEFHGKGLRRRDRVLRLSSGVERMKELAVPAGASLWGGSAAPQGAARLGGQGLGLVLSAANPLPLVAELAAAHRVGWVAAGCPGGIRPPVAALRNVWLTDDPHERLAVLDWQRASYLLYAGLGWSVAAQESAQAMDFLRDTDRAIEDAVGTAIIGGASEIVDGLHAVAAAGVDMTIFRVVIEGAPTEAVRSVLARLADEVLPSLESVEAA